MAIRSDLQNKAAKIGDTMTPKVPPSNQYGESARLMRGLKDVPAGKSPTSAPQEGKPKPVPGRVVDLLGPTQRPMEPITNGADFGPGMSALQAGVLPRNPSDDAIIELQNIARFYPDSGIADLLDKYGS